MAFSMQEQSNRGASPATAYHEHLRDKIANRSARVTVCGMGYVGLPLACAISANGFPVVAADIDDAKVEKLRAGESYIKHIPSSDIAAMVATGRFAATSDFREIADSDVVAICVPTPLNRAREPDLSYVVATTTSIAQNARPGQLIILESTTYPGTTVDVLQPIFIA